MSCGVFAAADPLKPPSVARSAPAWISMKARCLVVAVGGTTENGPAASAAALRAASATISNMSVA